MGCTSWNPKSIFRYNIVVGFSYPILGYDNLKPTNVVDWNCIWNSQDQDALQKFLQGPRETGTGKHSIIADPRFAAPALGDYRLLPDSPCAKMEPEGKTCGALGVVGPDFRDAQTPSVEAKVASKDGSKPASIAFRRADREPQLMSNPVLYTNANGVIISFETDIPCHAKVG